jgi:hypothetical protein
MKELSDNTGYNKVKEVSSEHWRFESPLRKGEFNCTLTDFQEDINKINNK